ncbi:hypothetical protein TWF569_002824 [Orbilia oligospora]|uniref:Uncharacterized protein n=1 Tax=Orbilia oligospora TaxID=2813651 RepID=A0A7C8JNL0_ORBOL|nr:hypothetical protein TWF706_003602 [Orbilia oligospora]KAF3121077.1 hypothetical protein TWF569_002824 [Orbilia oligospora]KAF3121916.1 hypothetical protein TWF594_003074 [Orbilia oligospora]KAF3123012.1 hypothetical protein TWF703_001030 [Orbilia oligospora]
MAEQESDNSSANNLVQSGWGGRALAKSGVIKLQRAKSGVEPATTKLTLVWIRGETVLQHPICTPPPKEASCQDDHGFRLRAVDADHPKTLRILEA